MKTRFFATAIRAAIRHSTHPKFRMGSVLVQKNHIVSIGSNLLRTHPKSPNKYKSIHAEFDAVIGIPQEKLVGGTVYVARVTRTGRLATSRPCGDCMTLLREAKIHTVCYIDSNREFQEEVV